MKVGELFSLKFISQKEQIALTRTKIEVTNLLKPNEPPHTVWHYHEKKWEDDAAMDNFTDIDEMIKIIEKGREYQPNAPVVVHCSAGLGRTGTLIGIYAILEALEWL